MIFISLGGQWASTTAQIKRAGVKALVVSVPGEVSCDFNQLNEIASAGPAGGIITHACVLDAVIRKRLSFGDHYMIRPAATGSSSTDGKSKRKR